MLSLCLPLKLFMYIALHVRFTCLMTSAEATSMVQGLRFHHSLTYRILSPTEAARNPHSHYVPVEHVTVRFWRAVSLVTKTFGTHFANGKCAHGIYNNEVQIPAVVCRYGLCGQVNSFVINLVYSEKVTGVVERYVNFPGVLFSTK